MATRRSSLTPQFSFGDATGQYRWESGPNKGQFVPRLAVRSALDDYIGAKEKHAVELAEKLRRREISFKEWQTEFERTLAKIHVASAAAAKGGWHAMTPADYGRVGQLYKQELAGLKGEHRGLRGLVEDMNNGLPLDGRWMQRIRQYSQAGRHTYHVVETLEMEEQGYDEERSVRHASDSCDECIEQEALGWQKIKDKKIKQPGDRKCKRNCKCGKEYRKSHEAMVASVRTDDDGEDNANVGGLMPRDFVDIWHDTVDAAEREAVQMGVMASYPKGNLDAANLISQALRENQTLGLPLPRVIRADAEQIAENVRIELGESADPSKVPMQFVVSPGAKGKPHHEILINDDASVWQPGEENAAEAAARLGAKGFFSTSTPLHFVRNEMGHFLHFDNDAAEYSRLSRGAFGATSKPIAERVSDYAASSPHEFVAEVYCGLVEAKLKGDQTPYDDEVMALYRRLKGREP